jgi:hypothetical protein
MRRFTPEATSPAIDNRQSAILEENAGKSRQN